MKPPSHNITSVDQNMEDYAPFPSLKRD